MSDAFEAFKECGSGAWLCLLLGVMGAAAGITGAVLLATTTLRAARIAGSIAIAFGVLSLGAGLLARQMGLTLVEGAVAGESIDPAQKARILAVGRAEANQCIKIGAATGALPFVLGALAVGVGLGLRKEPD